MVTKFNSAKEFVASMMENEGSLFFDHYGREWRYENYQFTFKDIGADSVHRKGIKCLHLFGTFIEMLEPKS
jgi:hypothetical protein